MNLSVQDISQRLSERADDVCSRLFPSGKQVNGHWVVGSLSGDAGDSLKIHLTGQHAGKWKDWATDEHGDLLDLWSAVNGTRMPDTLSAVRDYLGLPKEPATLAQRTYEACPSSKSVQPLSDAGKGMEWLMRERRINPEIIRRFKVEGDSTKRAIVFPCYNLKGELVSRSYRTLDKKTWVEAKTAPCLFGWHALSPECFKKRAVIICEGQIDALTWAQWGFDCLSVRNGVADLTWIEYEWDNLAAFDTIYLAYDMDAAGSEWRIKVARRLGVSRCLLVDMPHKDANDCLKADMCGKDAERWIEDAKAVRLENFICAGDLKPRLREMLKQKEAAFTLSFLKGQDEFTGFYFRPGELTIWTGAASAGKSTMLNYVMLQLVADEIPVYVASFEMKAEKVLMQLLRTLTRGDISEERLLMMADNCGQLIAFCDILGYVKKEVLFEQMQFSFQRYGAQHFFIDSLMRVEGLEEEWDLQGQFMNELAKFAKENDVHIHLVAHARKIADGQRPSKSDIKGSSLLVNNADNIIAITRNAEKDKAKKEGKPCEHMHDTELSIEKQRETGWQGAVRLKFDLTSRNFVPMTT